MTCNFRQLSLFYHRHKQVGNQSIILGNKTLDACIIGRFYSTLWRKERNSIWNVNHRRLLNIKDWKTTNSFVWSRRHHSHGPIDENAERITVHFVDLKKDGKKQTVQARVGATVLDTTREFGVDLEGACEASLACSTCHCYIPLEYHDLLPEPEEEEEDMLDMAYGLQEESRLGCQIHFTKEMDGITITLPRATRNYYVDKEK